MDFNFFAKFDLFLHRLNPFHRLDSNVLPMQLYGSLTTEKYEILN